MRCVLALVAITTALSAQSTHPVQAKSTQTKSKSKPAAAPKMAHTGTAVVKSNLKSGTQSAHTTGSRRLVNGRWVASSRRAGPPKPIGQQHPEPERYQEIQKALQDRGYFKGETSGVWSDDSTEAVKRFQTDQNLPNDGKLSSKTLIGLGLGPKHDSGPVTSPPPSSLPPATAPPISPETVPALNKPPSQ